MRACQHVPAGASTSQLLTTNSKTDRKVRSKSLIIKCLVPKKGLEPPHPCEYVDLNHARLPIPPLRHETQPGAIGPTGSISESRKSGFRLQIVCDPLRLAMIALRRRAFSPRRATFPRPSRAGWRVSLP